MDFNKENMRKMTWLITFAVVLYVGVRNLDVVLGFLGSLWGLIFPFVIGCAIAFVLNVPMAFVERNLFGGAKDKRNRKAAKIARPVSLCLSVLFVALLIVVVFQVVVPELASTFVSVVKAVENSIPKLQSWAEETFHKDSLIVSWLDSLDFQPEKMLDSAAGMLKNGVNNILSSTISVTKGIVNVFVNFGIGFVFACYILLQKEKLTLQVKKAAYAILPERAVKYILHVCEIAYRIFASFITGQCIEAVILGFMFFVVLSVGRFPYAMLIGVLISFTALIPVFGAFIGCAVGCLLILMESPMKAVVFLGIFLLLQQIEGNLIYPHVVGGSVGLPAIWVLVAVTLGGSLMGVAGMLIFIPAVSVCYTLFREWVYGRLKEKKIKVS
ncbi:MAG: AI-2E family transporter [Eubacteriales bacterium]|nr:AI-2E family transporter [Eubacteriales bacterium]